MVMGHGICKFGARSPLKVTCVSDVSQGRGPLPLAPTVNKKAWIPFPLLLLLINISNTFSYPIKNPTNSHKHNFQTKSTLTMDAVK